MTLSSYGNCQTAILQREGFKDILFDEQRRVADYQFEAREGMECLENGALTSSLMIPEQSIYRAK